MPDIPESNEILSAIPELEGEVNAAHFLQGDIITLLAWGAVALICIAAVLIIWWVRRSRKKAPAAPSPLESALTSLTALEQTLPPLRECSLQISLIVRQYLQGQVQDPALYETHEEFSQRLDSLSSVPKECQYDTRYLLEKLADLKYAGNHEQDPVQAHTLIEQARALLKRIDEMRRLQAPGSPTLPTKP